MKEMFDMLDDLKRTGMAQEDVTRQVIANLTILQKEKEKLETEKDNL
jgi:hypothetical protein